MSTPPTDFSPYYYSPQMRYQNQLPQQHAEQSIPTAMQQAQPGVDPSLALYHPSYYSYNQQHPQMPMMQQHHQNQNFMHPPMNLMPHSSPSSPNTESVDTPPGDASLNSRKRTTSSGASGSRKKVREDDADDDDEGSPSADKEEGKPKATRGSRACTVCRRLKMKCVGAEEGPPCKRCQAGHHECIFEESNRGKRSTNSVKKHEQLTRSLKKMERTLDTVLRSISNPSLTSAVSGMMSRSPSPGNTNKNSNNVTLGSGPSPTQISTAQDNTPSSELRLHSLPDNSLNPLGLLAEASLANQRSKFDISSNQKTKSNQPDSSNPAPVGVASDHYFKPGPMTILPLRRMFIERQIQPEMLKFTSAQEVKDLFKIYFDHLNNYSCLLEDDFHTPSLVCSRSPLLLTTICAIAAKFYSVRPELHVRLTNMARKLAFNGAEQGYKSVEIVQAYLLLTFWGCGPVERYERDRTWMLLGLAIRMAIDLNLHRKTATSSLVTDEARSREKEVRNRERTWLLVFALDHAFSHQMGKPTSVKEDSIIRNACIWWKHPEANPNDAKLCAYVELQCILARSLELLSSESNSVSGLQINIDYYVVIRALETQLFLWRDQWQRSGLEAGGEDVTLIHPEHPGNLYFNYAMLTINAFGLQDALERSPVNIGHFFSRCHSSATACANVLIDNIGASMTLQYAPDTHFVAGSYAALSLLKLIRPEFQQFLVEEQKTINLIKAIADLYEKVAVNPQHTPALYSIFLKAVISSRLEPQSVPASEASVDFSPPDNEAATISDTTRGNSQFPDPTADINIASSNPPLPPSEYQFNELGPVADISTFPPTMAPDINFQEHPELMSIDNILSSNFWDSVLVPGYSNTMEGLSSGFVYGAGGSGMIAPRLEGSQHMNTGISMMGSRDDLNGANIMYHNPSGMVATTGY